MNRMVKLKRAAEAPSSVARLDALSDAELASLARERGLTGVPERWKRETLLAKLGAA